MNQIDYTTARAKILYSHMQYVYILNLHILLFFDL